MRTMLGPMANQYLDVDLDKLANGMNYDSMTVSFTIYYQGSWDAEGLSIELGSSKSNEVLREYNMIAYYTGYSGCVDSETSVCLTTMSRECYYGNAASGYWNMGQDREYSFTVDVADKTGLYLRIQDSLNEGVWNEAWLLYDMVITGTVREESTELFYNFHMVQDGDGFEDLVVEMRGQTCNRDNGYTTYLGPLASNDFEIDVAIGTYSHVMIEMDYTIQGQWTSEQILIEATTDYGNSYISLLDNTYGYAGYCGLDDECLRYAAGRNCIATVSQKYGYDGSIKTVVNPATGLLTLALSSNQSLPFYYTNWNIANLKITGGHSCYELGYVNFNGDCVETCPDESYPGYVADGEVYCQPTCDGIDLPVIQNGVCKSYCGSGAQKVVYGEVPSCIGSSGIEIQE
jgi:hypothetical protein